MNPNRKEDKQIGRRIWLLKQKHLIKQRSNKMEIAQMKEMTKNVFQGAEDAYDQDSVLAEMFAAGIPFGKLKTLYKTVGIAEGFIADPAVVKEAVTGTFDESIDDITAFETWGDVEEFVEGVASEVEGATETQVLRMLRAYVKEGEDLELPKKAKGGPRKRGGALAEAIVSYANGTEGPQMSNRGFYDAVLPTVKGPKNAHYYVGAFFSMIYAVKNGITLDQANDAIKKMPVLKLADLEAEVA